LRHSVCTVTNFSAAEKERGVKFCTPVQLLSGQVFSHFGGLLLVGSHGGGITFRDVCGHMIQLAAGGEAPWGFGIGCRGSLGQSELGAAALRKAVWWDLRFASLLMHLFLCCLLLLC